MSLTPYHLHWSDALIRRVELRLRQLHLCLEEFYRKHNYTVSSPTATTVAAADGDENATGHPEGENGHICRQGGAIQSVGSFLLRTCVHSSPFCERQQHCGVGADITLTVPSEVCSLKDIQDGLYLERRHAFLLKVEKFLKTHSDQMAKKAKSAVAAAALNKSKGVEEGRKRKKPQSDENNKDDGNDEDAEEERKKFLLWDIQCVPFGGCWANAEKQILRVVFVKVKDGVRKREVFHVDVHFHPIELTGRIASAAAIRKHPLYSYLVMEDALMTVHMRKLHELYLQSHSLLRATVFLKCWASHVGITTRASGHPEGLSGFHLSAIVLRLVEEGVISAAMTEENVVRAVWVRLSLGFTPKDKGNNHIKESLVPAAEERGEVAVLRLAGDTINLFFRTSVSFFQNVIKKAADEALQLQHSSMVLSQTPFQPLQLRMDLCFVVEGLATYFSEVDRSALVKTSGATCSVSERETKAIREIVQEALGTRSNYSTVWCRGEDAVHVAIQLTSDSEGRNRLTRGPAVEDSDAVARFNDFWGLDITSTRQFSDGGIYRCVLWSFDEDVGTHTTVALPATTVVRRVLESALRKHITSSARVSVLFGGLEGVLTERIGAEWRDSAPFMQKSLMEACREVEEMVANIPRTALPCKITSLDIISASERHTAVFPVRPHLALTYTTDDLLQPSFSGISTAPTIEVVHGVLMIDDKGKIPDTLEAIANMKGAICAQLSKVLEKRSNCSNSTSITNSGDGKGSTSGKVEKTLEYARKKDDNSQNYQKGAQQQENVGFRVRTSCTNLSVDIFYKGYLFRLYVAHYREVSLLRALQRESEAATIERKLFWGVQHAKFLRSIAFGHHSYATATRLAGRWMSAMLLHEFILPEVVELLVANAYLGQNPPKTAASGFVRFLHLLAMHDWSTPLSLPYSTGSKEEADAATLVQTRGEQQGMFIATPYAPLESPFTTHTPRPMIMHRVVQLAKAAMVVLMGQLDEGTPFCNFEVSVFTSDPASFDFQMAFHPYLVPQPDRLLTPPPVLVSADAALMTSNAGKGGGTSPTTTAMPASAGGVGIGAMVGSPSPSRVWQLDELEEEKSRAYVAEFVEREPAAHIVRSIRAVTRDRCMIFYDSLAPRSINVAMITPSPSREICQKLHDDILRVSRGALLPAVWTLPAATGIGGTKRAASALPSDGAQRHAAAAGVKGKALNRQKRRRTECQDEDVEQALQTQAPGKGKEVHQTAAAKKKGLAIRPVSVKTKKNKINRM